MTEKENVPKATKTKQNNDRTKTKHNFELEKRQTVLISHQKNQF